MESVSDCRTKYRDKWVRDQRSLLQKLVVRDELSFSLEEESTLRYIGGVDISFVKESDVDACACLVVLEYPSLKVVYENYEMVKLDLPYIAGFLGFRECPHLVRLVDILRETKPQVFPQVIFVDGNGILHPRGFGLACQLGVLTGVPTLGVAKKFLHVDGLSKDRMKSLEKMLPHGGSHLDIVGDSGRLWGAILRSTNDSTNGIYISSGHKISTETAVNLVKKVCDHRIPAPIRAADLGSRRFIRQNWQSKELHTRGVESRPAQDKKQHQPEKPKPTTGMSWSDVVQRNL